VTLWQLPQEILKSKDFDAVLDYILPQLQEPARVLVSVNKISEQKDKTSLELIKFVDNRVYEQYSQPHKLKDDIVGRVWSFRDVTQRVNLETKVRTSGNA